MDRHYLNIHRLGHLISDRRELYLNRLLQQLALSLVGIFVPLYLLKIGYTLPEVLAYIGVYYLSMMVFSFAGAFIEERIGGKHTMAASTPIYLIYFLGLFSLEFVPHGLAPLFLVAVVFGCAQQVYWLPTNTEFVKASDKKHRGKEISYLQTVPRVAALLTPLIGAFVLEYASFELLFGVVSFILILSIIPLFFTPDHKPSLNYDWKKVFSKKNQHFFDAFTAQGTIHTTLVFMWPINVFFLSNGELFVVGAAGSAVAAGVAIFNLIVGRISDKVDRMKILQAGGILTLVVMTYAFHATSLFDILAVSLLAGFAVALIDIPLFALACDEATEENVAEFLVFRESSLGVGRLLETVLAVLLILVLFTPENLKYAFILPAVAAAYFIFKKF